MPKAYFIAQIDVKDAEKFEKYRAEVPATIAQYGGRYIVRGGHSEVMEGEWPERRTVVLEFPSMAEAKTWHSSPEYKPLLELRQSASDGAALLVEGFEPQS